MQKFLGLENYYRWFVKNFARITEPLHKMMRKDVKQNQRKRQQKIFKELKERLTMELVLVTPYLDKEIRIEVYTLDFAIRRVLLIKDEDEQKLVAYIIE